jgi:hypothetical protein|tara:strand:- start:187605 stop:188141 length:537 start_codon:yes stop_codon:yes gene_type:complete
MIGPQQTYMVISLAFAVFAAIAAVGAAITLSVSFERLRSGFQKVKEMVDVMNRQTGFFSTAIHNIEQKVEALDARQDVLETKSVESNERTDSMLRYAETMVVQAKHEIKQEIQAAKEPDQALNDKQVDPIAETPHAPVRTGMEALLADHDKQSENVKGENAGVSSLYFGANSDHIRFV